MVESIRSYLIGSLEELHQVRWPTRQQAIRLSLIVVGFTLANSLAFGLIDYGLAELVRVLISFVA